MPNTGRDGGATEVRVAVGVIRDNDGRVLIARRPPHKHQGDLWEFPGGKIEAGESCELALERELSEELGIQVVRSVPLIGIPFSYADKKVFLDVREVVAFTGEPTGKEGQPLQWVSVVELGQYEFPAANTPIVKALRLPDFICITDAFADRSDLVSRIKGAASRGAGMLVFRPASKHASEITSLLPIMREACRREGVSLLAHSSIDLGLWSAADGVHFSAAHLNACERRPVGEDVWFGASCHNLKEIELAKSLGADYIFLSPVNHTDSHPGAAVLGWGGFEKLAVGRGVSAYALGGLGVGDLFEVRLAGGRGVAGISAFWK